MNAIRYLAVRELKNSLIDLLHHPGKLISYLFIIGMIGLSVFTSDSSPRSGGTADFRLLHGIYLAILLVLGLLSAWGGLKSGSTFFRMSDVNFLFVSPLSPKKILIYGLCRQMSALLLMMLFLLCYGSMLIANFGVGWGTVLLLDLGVAVLLFFCQILSMLIYSYTSGNPARILKVKMGIFLYVALVACLFAAEFLRKGGSIEAALAAASSPSLQFVPAVGWIKGAVFSLAAGQTAGAAVYTVLTVALAAGAVLLFIKSRVDYYEDVLQSTETLFEQKKEQKESRGLVGANFGLKKVKAGKTGIRGGWGAKAFFYKQMCELRRRSRFVFFSMSTVTTLLAGVCMGLFLNSVAGSGEDALLPDHILAIVLATELYILMFISMTGDWVRELAKPYIYLVPEKPFAKLFWACMTSMLKPFADGAVVFAVLCAILRTDPLTALGCVLVYGSFGLLLTAASVLFQRLFGSPPGHDLLTFLFMLAVLLLAAPGIAASAVLIFAAADLPWILYGLPAVLLNALISLGVFAACRNVLETAEMR